MLFVMLVSHGSTGAAMPHVHATDHVEFDHATVDVDAHGHVRSDAGSSEQSSDGTSREAGDDTGAGVHSHVAVDLPTAAPKPQLRVGGRNGVPVPALAEFRRMRAKAPLLEPPSA